MKSNGIKQIAERAGVTHSTVSRVLNNRPGISPETRSLVLKLAKEMNYRSIPQKRVVAVLMQLDADGFDLYTALLMQALASELNRRKFRSIFIYKDDMDLMSETLICGCISLLFYGHIAKEWARWQNLPLICLNDFNCYSNGIPSVCSDDNGCIHEIMKRLVSMGHKEIAWIVYLMDTCNSAVRLESFLHEAKSFGVHPHLIDPGSFCDNDGSLVLTGLTPEITAVINPAETYLPLMVQLLQEHRPHLQLVSWGFPNDPSTRPGAIRVSQDYCGLARAAVDLLEQWSAQQPIGNRVASYIFSVTPEHGNTTGKTE